MIPTPQDSLARQSSSQDLSRESLVPDPIVLADPGTRRRALVSAPLFDRYFHFRLALASKILVHIMSVLPHPASFVATDSNRRSGISFFALIWAVKPEGLPGLYILAVLMGVSSFIMLPVELELSAEVVFKVAGRDDRVLEVKKGPGEDEHVCLLICSFVQQRMKGRE